MKRFVWQVKNLIWYIKCLVENIFKDSFIYLLSVVNLVRLFDQTRIEFVVGHNMVWVVLPAQAPFKACTDAHMWGPPPCDRPLQKCLCRKVFSYGIVGIFACVG